MSTVGEHQALDSDYRHAGAFTRGHLYPNGHAFDQEQAESTFTLTNIAPQHEDDNHRWTAVETDIMTKINDKCNSKSSPKAYVVTGVTPGPKTSQLNKRVNIPSHFWSAFCCRDKKDQNKFISGGYMMKMDSDEGFKSYTVNELNNKLGKEYGNTNFRVFGELPGCSNKQRETPIISSGLTGDL